LSVAVESVRLFVVYDVHAAFVEPVFHWHKSSPASFSFLHNMVFVNARCQSHFNSYLDRRRRVRWPL